MEKQGHIRRRLVLVPFPFEGHLNPMLQLGAILHSKGFSITVAHTKFNSPDTCSHPDLVFLPLSDGLSSTPKASEDFVDFTPKLNLHSRAPLQEVLTQIIQKQQQHEELPCIIYDAGMYCAEAVAHHLMLPSIILYTGTATNLLAYYAYPRLIDEGYIPAQDPEEIVPGLHPLRFKDLPVLNFRNLDALLQLTATSRNMGTSSAIIWNSMYCLEQSSVAQFQQQYQVPVFPVGPMHKIAPTSSNSVLKEDAGCITWLGTSSAIIWNSMYCLEQSSLTQFQQQYQVPVFPVGPMHKIAPTSSSSLLKEDSSCITWLDKQTHNSVIYVSLGSIASMDEKEHAEMAWGLANSKQPFLWVLRPGSVHGSGYTDLLPNGFNETIGEKGCIVKWAPQKEVLAHSAVGGFWSHCGWNSTLESISEGVPIISRPSFGDQRVNARYVSHVWKIGFEFENPLERGKIAKAIRRLMVEKEGEEMRQRALDLKVNAELGIKKGGSSYNSLNELVELIMSV